MKKRRIIQCLIAFVLGFIALALWANVEEPTFNNVVLECNDYGYYKDLNDGICK